MTTSHDPDRSTAIFALMASAFVGTAVAAEPNPGDFRAAPRVILHQWGEARALPDLLRERLPALEHSLPGVDGLFLFLPKSSFAVMTDRAIDEELLREELRPAAAGRGEQCRYHFALVYNDRPADLFDDWSVPLANWTAFAKACREAGLVGIAFDNEEYFGTWANYPNDCKYEEHTLAEYQEQARRRGREVMRAIIATFPEAIVTTLHGPTLSASNGPRVVYARPDHNELWGPFFAGMLEGRGKRATLVDGGELYGLRTGREFERAYRWRKWGIASNRVNTPFIPRTLRAEWPSVSLAWGIYDSPDEDTGRGMDPATFSATLAEAVARCDHFVWVYFEGRDMLRPGQDDWKSAIRDGKTTGLRLRTNVYPALQQR